MHIICPPKFGISFFFDYFFWDGCNTLEKWKAKVMQNFWGQINCIMGDVYVPNRFCLSCLQLFRERFRKNVHATIPKGIGMLSNLLLLFCFSTRRYVHDLSRLPFFQISLKNSELKTTHNTFRGCRVHFIPQPCTAWNRDFLWQLFVSLFKRRCCVMKGSCRGIMQLGKIDSEIKLYLSAWLL